jgi:sulfate adenylyltransferase
MLGGGYFTPLTGFMSLAESQQVARDMTLASGLFWPVPIVNVLDDVSAIAGSDRIALRDPNVAGNPVIAVMQVSQIDEASDDDMDEMIRLVFGTEDGDHPGVAAFRAAGRHFVAGDVEVLNLSYFEEEFEGTFKTAVDIREEIDALGWETVVAFQTRNPMHLAHEELCRIAQERVGADGIIIHMLLGKLKAGDIPAGVRDRCIREMVQKYFPANTVLVNGYGFDMLYAGPREALLHAVFRQNMGATHLIVGRDHAGVGDYYGPFDAQTVFENLPEGALEIEIFAADHTAWSKKLGKVVMLREAPDHSPEDFVFLSGTKVREMLGQGISPPKEFTRPEVAAILIEHYRAQAAA